MRTHVKKAKYAAHLRDMSGQGLINLPDGTWGSYSRSASLNGGMKCWRSVYLGTFPSASKFLPAFGLNPKTGK